MDRHAPSGAVIWLTGKSGVGKTTVAIRLRSMLQELGHAVVVIDGDEIRKAIGDDDCGYAPDGRLLNAYRICRISRMLARQGVTVVVATMSLFHEIHAWNRKEMPGYFEVCLEACTGILKKRDPKGLYQMVEKGMERNLAGVDIEAEMPIKPHLQIDNSRDLDDVTPVAKQILGAFLSRKKERR